MKWLERKFEEQLRAELLEQDGIQKLKIGGLEEIDIIQIVERGSVDYENELDRWKREEWRPAQDARLPDILHSAPHNAKRYQDLYDAMNRRQVVPFVGAGMSRASGISGWGSLLASLLNDSSCDKRRARQLLRGYAFEAAADLIRAGMPPALFNEQLNHLCRIESTAIAGPIRLLPTLFAQLVLTTNFDEVLEFAYSYEGLRMERILYGEALATYRREQDPALTTLLKIHGDYRYETGRVFTTDEYNAAYGSSSLVLRELRLAAATNSLLFLGAGLGPDRTVELLRRAAADDANQPKHYTFQPLPPTDRKRRDREHFLV